MTNSFNYASKMLEIGNYEKAIFYFMEDLNQYDCKNYASYNNIGFAHMQLGLKLQCMNSLQNAVTHFNKAIQLALDDGKYYYIAAANLDDCQYFQNMISKQTIL